MSITYVRRMDAEVTCDQCGKVEIHKDVGAINPPWGDWTFLANPFTSYTQDEASSFCSKTCLFIKLSEWFDAK